MTASDMTVRSVADLIHHIQELRDHVDQELWFRGHSSIDYVVAPSIWRGYTRIDERNFSNRFRARAAIRYANSPEYQNYAGWLSLMQHYGLPTRLLDWSRSPLIAVYFALERYLEGSITAEDARIWILKPFKLNHSEGFEKITPAIDAYMCSEMLRPAFSNWNTVENEKVIAVMSTETDLRMFVQQGCFTIHSRMDGLETMDCSSEFISSITVPKSSVLRLADEIRVCGIRKGDIYPDLANLALDLKNAHPKGWAATT